MTSQHWNKPRKSHQSAKTPTAFHTLNSKHQSCKDHGPRHPKLHHSSRAGLLDYGDMVFISHKC